MLGETLPENSSGSGSNFFDSHCICVGHIGGLCRSGWIYRDHFGSRLAWAQEIMFSIIPREGAR